ncbi:endoplasmic reticulum resident protein 27 isoform X2 [Heteronotia binoei]|uniref:endoplasmic reticulum resident protein 27 isoform X2 n=1 Tax=Heteronotia binoei TaxID=13085 RepID=UPI00292D2251|nr:endoplasmic reticulum resident protein 27 isoform X2 [Heteronotia binoei]
MARKGKGRAMGICISQGFLVFLFSGVLLLECAGKEPMPQGAAEDVKEPIILENVAATDAFIKTAELVVIGFFQDSQLPEASEFLTMVQNVQDVLFGFCNSSNVLSHYNITVSTVSLFRMTAIGLFNSTVQTHLLLFTDKSSPNHTERMDKYHEAARLFQGKILFILVDCHAKGNDRVMSYFHLKKSQLPAVALYHTPDEEQDVLPLGEVTLEAVKDFCNSFLQRKQGKDNLELEDKIFKQEL